jgi:hypothetical protein
MDQKELLVAPLTQLVLIDHETIITHFDVCSSRIPHSLRTIVARHARFVPVRALGSAHRLTLVGLYIAPSSLTPPTYILVQIFQVANPPSPSTLLYYLIMNLSAHALRGLPASESMGLLSRLLHTLVVLCATSLMLVIAVISFLFVLLFKSITPAPGPRRSAGRHVTFHEPSTVITLPPSGAVAQRSPAKGTAPSLSLTATPRELEPPTPDGAEDPLLALVRICGFLASNSARAWRGEELAATPPLAGLAAYLDPVKEDLERISEMVADKREEERKDIVGGAGGDSEVAVAAAGESAGAGAGADADADAHDEPGLVRPDRAATHARPPTPTPPSPLTRPDPNTSTSTSIPTSTPPTSEPTAQHASVTLADSDTTITTTTATTAATVTMPQGTRKRKDAVLRTKRPSIDPSNADALADTDDAAVRAAVLLSRVADLGAGLFDGAVRERGASLWNALSRRGTPTDVPVPPLPRTHFTTPTGERS